PCTTGPSPAPVVPWHTKQYRSYSAWPVSIDSGVGGIGFVAVAPNSSSPCAVAGIGGVGGPPGAANGTLPGGAGRVASYGSNAGELRMKLKAGMDASVSSSGVHA